MNLSDFHYDSPLGTDFILRPFFDAKNAYAGHDHLLAQIYGGSYPSTAADPLFAVQVGMFPLDGHLTPPAPVAMDYLMLLPQLTQHGAAAHPSGSGVLGDIDLKDFSPQAENQVTTHTTNWGLNISADLGKEPGVGVGASYDRSKTWTIADMQVFVQTYQSPATSSNGVIWDLVFTRKDGMNRSSLPPRLDALFACSKTKLRGGRLNFLLVERTLHWGSWAEHIELTVGDSSGIGAGVGAVLGLGILSVPFAAVGAAIGAVVGAAAGAPEQKAKHNETLARAQAGDPTAVNFLMLEALQEKKARSSATLFCLDFDAKTVTRLASLTV